MRLHSVRFKRLPNNADEAFQAAEFIKDVVMAHKCYLQKCWDHQKNTLVWIAVYAP